MRHAHLGEARGMREPLGGELVRHHHRVHVHQPEDQPGDDLFADVELIEGSGLRRREERSIREEIGCHAGCCRASARVAKQNFAMGTGWGPGPAPGLGTAYSFSF